MIRGFRSLGNALVWSLHFGLSELFRGILYECRYKLCQHSDAINKVGHHTTNPES